ncbi:MAG: aminodeoxychorismate synthase component I, partial [Planctomycetota bacterium]
QTPDPSGPPFQGGVAGYFSYDLGRLVERIPSRADSDLGLDELWLGFYDVVASTDLETGRTRLVSTGLPQQGRGGSKRSRERLENFMGRVESGGSSPGFEVRGELCSNFTRSEYEAAVERCRRYIIAGDVFQVNLSQRFEIALEGSPFGLYEKLRSINPAPFASYLHTGEADIVSASPERYLLVDGPAVQTRPIKGTRPRGKTVEEDRRLAEELFGSQKDRAENTMIVDLLRNDLGRVCVPGTIRVAELCALETFPTVHHLTSTVEGRLDGGRGRIDLLRAAFPGGSITGAPKIRAMEIIEELEPTRRSIYTGSMGYLDFAGRMDLNIVIRTILCSAGRAVYQVGGGIVYDSEPAMEYEETLHKGRALADALSCASGPTEGPDSKLENP